MSGLKPADMIVVTFRLLPPTAAVFAAGVLLVTSIAAPVRAADASAFDGEARSAVRLIAGTAAGAPPHMVLRAGVEIKLDPGWKTYWRYPGDSGVPPRFSFARSDNVASVALSWPAPRSLSDGSGSSIGYVGRVIFPLRIVAQDPGKPVVLRLDLDYAVCEKLCVPAEAKVELVLAGTASALDTVLAASEARVPKPVAIGQSGPLAIASVTRDSAAKPVRIMVDVTAPDAAVVELFAEGPTPDWALPIPEPVPGAAPGSRRFAFDLDGLPPGASADGAILTLTAVSAEAAIEATSRLQ